MVPLIVLGKDREDVLRSLVNAASSVTIIKNSIVNITPEAEERFRFIQLELVSVAHHICGKEGMEDVMNAVDLIFD